MGKLPLGVLTWTVLSILTAETCRRCIIHARFLTQIDFWASLISALSFPALSYLRGPERLYRAAAPVSFLLLASSRVFCDSKHLSVVEISCPRPYCYHCKSPKPRVGYYVISTQANFRNVLGSAVW